ncbi:MAG: isoprenylcysteine carboxylmethyltransferase family protein [Aigarchaeota archaeon]|nr:isoprenylcysteine carboxylmethyltransferase family protein [Candidatus Pelearchaeum maunauluense]
MKRALLFIGHFIFFTIVFPSILYIIAYLVRSIAGLSYYYGSSVASFLGLSLVIIGVWIMLRAEIDMYRHGGGGTPIPFYSPPQRLVKEGIYRCTRNPMYLGTTMEYVGIGLHMGEYIMIILAFIILSLAMMLYLKYEMPFLSKRFGDEFNEYVSSTPLLLPNLGCVLSVLSGQQERREAVK